MKTAELGFKDIEEIKRLMVEIFSGEPWNDLWPGEQLHLYITEILENKNALSFGLYENGRLSGMALGKIKHWYTGDEYWIEEFGIVPESQGSGKGSRFMAEIESQIKSRGIVRIVLLTDRSVPAYHFYKRNGFDEKAEQVVFTKVV